MFNVNNTCQFEGRIAKEPEFKVVGQGQNAFNKCTFSIAVDRQLSKSQREAKKNGQDVVSADFPQFVAIGAKADLIQSYFQKGKPIKIWATYQSYVTTDNAGNKRYGHIFQVEELGFTISDTTQRNGNNNAGANNGGNYGNGGGNYNKQGNGYNSNNNRNNYSNNANANNRGGFPPAVGAAVGSGDFYDISDDEIPF